MTHWKTQFNYDYLGAYSLPDGKDIILTIRETKKEQVVGASGKKEECFVAYFFENVKPMILNRTNCKTLTKIFKNPNFESWINKQIQSPAAIILMLSACSLAEGEPEPGKLIIALLIVFITVIYVLVCNYLNVKRHGGESSMYR